MFYETYSVVSGLFKPDTTRGEAMEAVHSHGIGALLVKQSDPIWDDPSSWVHSLDLAYESACCRIYLIPEINPASEASSFNP
jgi:hypothetical protein